MGKPEFIISENTGKEILDWCNAGIPLSEKHQINIPNESQSSPRNNNPSKNLA